MNRERRMQLQWDTTQSLTEEEVKEGYHFCWDWDGLLIHKDDPEFGCCVCSGGDVIRAQSTSYCQPRGVPSINEEEEDDIDF